MFKLTVMSKDKVLFEGETNSLIVPGVLGYMELLTDHAPILSTLHAGKLIFRFNEEKRIYAISNGTLQFSNNHAIILGDAIESAEEIDLNRAEKNHYQLSKRLDATHDEHEREILHEALLFEENRIKVAKGL